MIRFAHNRLSSVVDALRFSRKMGVCDLCIETPQNFCTRLLQRILLEGAFYMGLKRRCSTH